MGIFKAYDIRGVVPNELDEAKAESIGRAFATFIGKGPIVAGRDMRVSSPSLHKALVEGINAAGVDVIDVGMISTPMLYFAVGRFNGAGGVTVTASHNPGRYNGFKMCKAQSVPLSESSGLPDIEKLSKTGVKAASTKGSTRQEDVREGYMTHVASFAREERPVRIAIDAANGMSGITLQGIFDRIKSECIPMYFDPDGDFPHHEANPIKAENIVDLQKLVRESGADFGAGFDGDADRCVFIDEKGEALPGDITTALIAKEYLEAEKGAAIVYDLRSSHVVREEVAALGGKPVRDRVGHSFIKMTMREHGAPFAGELSGHYYFRDHFYADCGEIALMKVLGLVSKSGKPLSELVAPLRKYHLSGEINFHVEDKDAKIRELAQKFSTGKIDYLDGITVEFGDWWFNVRKSNTEPMLRLNLEGKSAHAKAEGMKMVLAVLGEPE